MKINSCNKKNNDYDDSDNSSFLFAHILKFLKCNLVSGSMFPRNNYADRFILFLSALPAFSRHICNDGYMKYVSFRIRTMMDSVREP